MWSTFSISIIHINLLSNINIKFILTTVYHIDFFTFSTLLNSRGQKILKVIFDVVIKSDLTGFLDLN